MNMERESKPDLILLVFDFQIAAVKLYKRFGFVPVDKVVMPMLLHSGSLVDRFYVKRFEDISSEIK